jgi:hypothetical protein
LRSKRRNEKRNEGLPKMAKQSPVIRGRVGDGNRTNKSDILESPMKPALSETTPTTAFGHIQTQLVNG